MDYTVNEDGTVTKHQRPKSTDSFAGSNNDANKRLKNQNSYLSNRCYALERENVKLKKHLKSYRYSLGLILVLPIILIIAYILYLNLSFDQYYIISSRVNIRNEKNYDDLYVIDSKDFGDKVKGRIDTRDGWCKIMTYNPFKRNLVRSHLIASSEEFEILESVVKNKNCRTELRDKPLYSRAIIDYFTNHESHLSWRVYKLGYKSNSSSTSKKKFTFYIKHNITGESRMIKYKIESDNPIYNSEIPITSDTLSE